MTKIIGINRRRKAVWGKRGRPDLDTDDGGTADVTFAHDALGRRVRKTTATMDTVFVQAGQQVIADYTAGAAPTSPREKYVYASYIDEPILKDGTLASGTGIVYYHRNQQYSVTALTDAAGSVIERYAHDPLGALTILDASGTPLATQQSSVSNPITYTGRELDIETHLYHFRARLYSPTLGRFLARDPLGYVDGMSLYRGYFVPGATDPTGEVMEPLTGAAAIAVVIGAVAACAAPYHFYSLRAHRNQTDKFRHCWVSCAMAKTCTAQLAQLAGLGKELRDSAVRLYCKANPDSWLCRGGQGDWADSLDDLIANQQCVVWKTYIPVINIFSNCWRETCFDCCTQKGL